MPLPANMHQGRGVARRPRPQRRQHFQPQQAAHAQPTLQPAHAGAGARPPQMPAPAQPRPFTPDAQYLAWAAQRQFERSQELGKIQNESTTDTSNTQEAIRRLLTEVPQQRVNIGNAANKSGLFYSTQHTQQLDKYQSDVARQQGDLELSRQQREAARAAAKSAILRGVPVEQAAAQAEAIARRLEQDRQTREDLLRSMGY